MKGEFKVNIQELVSPYLYTEAKEIDKWIRDSLRGSFGVDVDNPKKYKEILKKFESGEFEFIHSMRERKLILKRKDKVISEKYF